MRCSKCGYETEPGLSLNDARRQMLSHARSDHPKGSSKFAPSVVVEEVSPVVSPPSSPNGHEPSTTKQEQRISNNARVTGYNKAPQISATFDFVVWYRFSAWKNAGYQGEFAQWLNEATDIVTKLARIPDPSWSILDQEVENNARQ